MCWSAILVDSLRCGPGWWVLPASLASWMVISTSASAQIVDALVDPQVVFTSESFENHSGLPRLGEFVGAQITSAAIYEIPLGEAVNEPVRLNTSAAATAAPRSSTLAPREILSFTPAGSEQLPEGLQTIIWYSMLALGVTGLLAAVSCRRQQAGCLSPTVMLRILNRVRLRADVELVLVETRGQHLLLTLDRQGARHTELLSPDWQADRPWESPIGTSNPTCSTPSGRGLLSRLQGLFASSIGKTANDVQLSPLPTVHEPLGQPAL